MSLFKDKISIEGFSIETMDISEIEKFAGWLPTHGVIDLNIAEQGLVVTLNAQNLCQEKISQLDLWIAAKEAQKNKAWTEAALIKAPAAGHKTSKDKEWFALADDDYINAINELTKAKACKKWFENKADLFSGWHYSFKTFLRRDYGLEKLGNQQAIIYENNTNNDDISGGEIEWK